MNLLRMLGAEALMLVLGTVAVLGVMWWARRCWRQRFREPFYQPILRPPIEVHERGALTEAQRHGGGRD